MAVLTGKAIIDRNESIANVMADAMRVSGSHD